jgi:hypothetical protein
MRCEWRISAVSFNFLAGLDPRKWGAVERILLRVLMVPPSSGKAL